MKNYDDFVAELERFENEHAESDYFDSFCLMQGTLNNLGVSLKFIKKRKKYNLKGDFSNDDKLLFAFFGNARLKEQEKKLKFLREKLGKLSTME